MAGDFRAEQPVEHNQFQPMKPLQLDLLEAWRQDRLSPLLAYEAPILPPLEFHTSPSLRAADVIGQPADSNDFKHVLPPLQIDGVQLARREPKIDPKFKDKGDAEAGVDHETARRLSQVLPNLAAYSERHGGIGPKLITAIMRNEHAYYGLKDVAEDTIASKTGNAFGALHDISIGPGQVKLSNIQDLQHKYPGLFGELDTHDLSRAATSKTFSTALVAAYLDDRIRTLESWDKHPPDRSKLSDDQKLLYDYSLPLWKSGQETKALISSFNPGDGRKHIRNVLRQMELIDSDH